MSWGRCLVGVVAATGAVLWLVGASGSAAQTTSTSPTPSGADLFETSCSTCHGSGGEGTDNGPSIVGEGGAAADFVLRTGRMPPGDIGVQAVRGPVEFSDEEIDALVGFVASLGNGPAVPTVDLSGADVTAGGEIYRESCAACHQAAGAGASLTGGRFAPSLGQATPTQIAEAIIVGPGAMPVFSTFTDQQIADVAAYVVDLGNRDEGDVGGASLGRVGPVAEGLLAWVGLGVLVGATVVIGTRRLS